MTRSSRARSLMFLLAGATPFALALIIGLVVYGAQRDRLPPRIATHFGDGGAADGFTATGWWPILMTAILLVAAAVLVLPQLRRDVPRNGRRGLVAAGWATAGLFGHVFTSTTLASAGLADPATARLGTGELLIGLALAAAAGLFGWLVAGPLLQADEPEPAAPAAPDERLDLGSGERAAWSRSTGSAGLVAILLAAAVITAAAVYYAHPDGLAFWPVVTVGIIVLAAVMLGSIRVTVDHRGLTVASRLIPVLRRRVPVDHIESAAQRDIRPLDYGGWGYRVLPGSTAVVLRAGEALVLRLRGGREFAVTIGDADTAAALLNTLVDRGRAEGRG